jgi:hypothetical protein
MNETISERKVHLIVGLCAMALMFAMTAFGPHRQAVRAARPINLGRVVYNVVDFGADPTGINPSIGAVAAALNACTGSASAMGNIAGCEIYFPAGTYSVQPTSTVSLTLPSDVPVTIAGAGQRSSTLMVVGSPADLFVGAGLIMTGKESDGFTMHDIGFVHPTGSSVCATFCADIHLPQAQNVTLYNLFFSGANTPIELGRTIGSGGAVGETNISAVTSTNTFSCLFRLDGGNGTTHIVGISADGGHNASSQVLCLPSGDVNAKNQFGTGTLRLADSTFTAFGRGISVTAYSLLFKNNYFDNLVINSAEDGPAFELFTPPSPVPTPPNTLPPPVIQDVRISNSRLVSASTACVLHGNLQLVRLVNDSCIGGQAAAVPAACMAAPSQRGYVLVEVTGSGVTGQSVTLRIGGTTPIAVTYNESSSDSAQAVASGLGSLIESSLAVTSPCPPLIPLEVFSDYLNLPVQSFSIGSNIELYTYQWGTAAPTFSVSSTSTGATLSLPGTVSTPSPADALYIGSPGTINGPLPPADVTVDQTAGLGATNGAGLHLQGGSAILITRSRLGDPISQNENGIEVDTSGPAYSDTQVQGNNLTGNTGQNLYFTSTGSAPAGNLTLLSNVGYDPVGAEVGPGMTCGTALINPFSTKQEVYIQGAFMGIKKDGVAAYGSGSSAALILGIGETLEIDCASMTGLPQRFWFGV